MLQGSTVDGLTGAGSTVEGLTVEVTHLTKRFGGVHAVEDLTFAVSPGRVTGFLGPNGAGKTTTLRVLLGLVAPTSGTATIGGRRYADLPHPLLTVGASLEATGFHAGRTAHNHLRVLATAAGLPAQRVDEVLALVGLTEAGRRRVGGYSMGMRQRLALAAALLGDPPVLLLDEPANGLDPEGIAWLRAFLRHLAAQGRTVLVSSHVLSEVQQTVDEVVIIARGRLVRQAQLAELEGVRSTLVSSPTPQALHAALAAVGLSPEAAPAAVPTHTSAVAPDGAGGQPVVRLRVRGVTPAQVGAVAFRAGVELHDLRLEDSDLESIFLSLTGGWSGGQPPGSPGPGSPGPGSPGPGSPGPGSPGPGSPGTKSSQEVAR